MFFICRRFSLLICIFNNSLILANHSFFISCLLSSTSTFDNKLSTNALPSTKFQSIFSLTISSKISSTSSLSPSDSLEVSVEPPSVSKDTSLKLFDFPLFFVLLSSITGFFICLPCISFFISTVDFELVSCAKIVP